MKRFVFVLAATAAFIPARAVAQGRMHPRWEIPGFDFSPNGVWRAKVRRIRQARARMLAQGNFAALNAARLAPARSTLILSDTQFVPAILFRYKDTDTTAQTFLHDTSQYSAALFSSSPPGGRPYTVRTFYEQMSNGVFSMQGKVLGWVNLDSNEVSYTGTAGTCTGNPFGGTSCNGLFSVEAVYRMQKGLREALTKLDATVDFGQFDNDGPDGIPNSGDDDGYVDMVAFAHPTRDGACGPAASNHLWSHRFVLVDSTETFYQDFVTNDPWTGHPGQFIKIRDYFLSSGVGGSTACDSTQIMPVGTVAHESGHGLGLPDLYDTQGSSEGIGEWGLMGAGNYTSPLSPSRMEAWSLSQFGWVTLAPITSSGDYAFGPAPTSDSAWMLRPTGSNPRGEYFLLENRQGVQADSALIRMEGGGGLLIWHVDSEQVTNHGFGVDNTVNSGAIHGVRLEEADGLGQLISGANRGDAGDPYPGSSANTVFDSAAGVNPSAVKNADGNWTGWRIDSITQVTANGPMSFRVVFPTALVMSSPATRPDGVMGAAYADTLKATGGSGTYAWAVTAGALPTGVSLSVTGVLSGFPHVTGAFNYTATATSGPQQVSRAFTFNTTAPVLVTADVVNQVLTGSGVLTADQLRYLDYLGNNTGTFDLGDFLAWVNATGAPLAAPRPIGTSRVPSKKGGRP